MNAQSVLAEFALPAGKLAALGNAGGFSGASLWRVAERWCLRAWPANISASHVVLVHRLMQQATDAGLLFVPRLLSMRDGGTFLIQQDRLWEMTTWMPGRADYAERPSPARLRAACQALARLHLAWQGESFPPQVCPAILRRLRAVEEGLRHLRGRPPVSSDLVPQAARAWHCLAPYLETIPRLLAPWTTVAVPVQWCPCDVWHDHLLFSGEALTGLVDYGAVKVDHVAVDLARLLGSLAGDDETAWRLGLDSYREVRPLAAESDDLARLLDWTATPVAVWTWLRRLYLEQRQYIDWSAIDRRLGALLDRLERSRLAGPWQRSDNTP